MATNLLSAAECKNATSNGTGIRKLHDGGGLYLWVYQDGRKYWRMRYWQAGKEKSLSFGVYPKVSLSDARKRRDELRQQLQADLDPSAERKAANLRKKLAAENSFEAVAREWYGKQVHTWVPHHASDVKRRLESNIFPTLGKRPIDQIEAPELLQTIRKIETRGAYDLAHRVLQVCGQVFRYGIATGRCSRNLSTDLRGALTPHKKQHQAAVRSEELPELLRAIAGYDETGDKQTRLALQLLAQTFVRTNELIGAEWVEFDLDNALWVIPAGRMKMKAEHVVPLSLQALAILAELKEISSGSRFVFPGRNRDKPISNNTMLFALYRLGYKGKMTGHGFRAVASTILNETGFNPDVIERQLAHCERNEVRGAYNRAEYLPERKRMMQHWADYLDGLAHGANVLPLHGKVA
ncbi:integrase arm-type DNA-binding domain-containing protein [Nitrosovibrio sp. Nv6]|uniref:tyrosine-type recombinase/integrase n=1 Tax=Nitrosovibrio sp. Nv6 TaxID=1855340 RepID=UPI0008C2B33A|nr:integrase arm-type DNA-binding domain-containing protein [Nitrosovibrio sp. Nv6]SEO85367.1 Integrase [Nitrosovibrio sp. Nv6]